MTEINKAEIVEELIKAIADQDYVETVKLQKNASVEGKTSSHLIDLYWEFADGGITYKTLISFQTLNTVAARADVVRLADMIRDVYGQTTGVLFSLPVYDKDVKVIAENASISLCEMLPPLPDTWEPVVENFQINADTEFIQKEKARLNITEQITVSSNNPKQLFLYNKNFECTDTIDSVLAEYIDKADRANFGRQKISHVFPEPAFLQTGHETMPFVKLLGVSFTLQFKLIRQMSDEDKALEIKELVEYILYNISRFIDFQ